MLADQVAFEDGKLSGLETAGFLDDVVIDHGERADASQNEVLGDLIGKGLHGDEQDFGALDSLLGLYTPEADLTVVEGNLI